MNTEEKAKKAKMRRHANYSWRIPKRGLHVRSAGRSPKSNLASDGQNDAADRRDFALKIMLFLSAQISQVIKIMMDFAPQIEPAGVELMIASQNCIEVRCTSQMLGFSAPHPTQRDARSQTCVATRHCDELTSPGCGCKAGRSIGLASRDVAADQRTKSCPGATAKRKLCTAAEPRPSGTYLGRSNQSFPGTAACRPRPHSRTPS